MMEGIRPKLDIEASTVQHGANGICNCAMGAFNGSVLIGRISSCGSNLIPKRLEKFLNFRVAVKFTPLIHEDVLVRDVWIMIREELPQPFNRRGLGDTSITVETTSDVIRDKNPRSFTVEAKVVGRASFILGFDATEREING